jgi:hypothetical protein
MRRIPRHLLYVTLDDLPVEVRVRMLPLLADLPRVPTAVESAQLIGPTALTLPALAVLARHIVQGLRDYNLTLAHDRAVLSAQRRKLLFLDASAAADHDGAAREAVVCLADATPALRPLLAARDVARLASFVTSPTPLPGLEHWRSIEL